MLDTEEEDEEMLRRAALKTMSRFKGKTSGPSDQNLRTNNSIKTNNKLNYYNNSHRNGSKRSNLIILTKTDNELSKSQNDSQHNNSFTKLMDRPSESSEKRKRVLPGRFSRLEREDTDEDSDEECSDGYESDDNQITTDCALSPTSGEQTVVLNDSQNISSEQKLIISEKIDDSIDSNHFELSDKTKDPFNGRLNEREGRLATNSIDSDRKETIKLQLNVSKSDALERRKQKFGKTCDEERVKTSADSSHNRNERLSVKNRLSNNSVDKQKNSNNERNYIKNISKDSIGSHRHHSNTRVDSMDSVDELDDCRHPSKKKLRSLVVMK